MDLRELQEMQVRLDEANGFPVRFPTPDGLYSQLTKDMVGLFGEVGEFANTLKKINIKRDKSGAYQLDLDEAEASLREELADIMIYALRIGAMLEMDLEAAIAAKIRSNTDRYASLRGE
jgi:NTP pyrophosphatase (non-canonical NTP hydrolase)